MARRKQRSVQPDEEMVISLSQRLYDRTMQICGPSFGQEGTTQEEGPISLDLINQTREIADSFNNLYASDAGRILKLIALVRPDPTLSALAEHLINENYDNDDDVGNEITVQPGVILIGYNGETDDGADWSDIGTFLVLPAMEGCEHGMFNLDDQGDDWETGQDGFWTGQCRLPSIDEVRTFVRNHYEGITKRLVIL